MLKRQLADLRKVIKSRKYRPNYLKINFNCIYSGESSEAEEEESPEDAAINDEK
jgi:hypothetical protein